MIKYIALFLLLSSQAYASKSVYDPNTGQTTYIIETSNPNRQEIYNPNASSGQSKYYYNE